MVGFRREDDRIELLETRDEAARLPAEFPLQSRTLTALQRRPHVG
jgi:hypothetical protein